MKRIIAVCAVGGLVFASFSLVQAEKKQLEGSVSISGAWALYPMALKWAEEFQKANPKVKIDVQAGGAGKGIADVLAGMVDIGNVSRDVHPEEISRGALAIAVTRDGVVPMISENNPFLGELRKKGIKKEQFVAIWITGKLTTWGQVLGNNQKAAIHVYTRSDACGAADTWAGYLGKRQEDLSGVGVYGDPGLADAVKRDPLGIGYNNINFAYDAKTLKPVSGIVIVPIDLNGSGQVETAESFYATRDQITQAIVRNAYPYPPARDLYFVTKGKPAKKAVAEFIRWVLTDGQKYVPETGYIALNKEKLAQGLRKIR
ncbi:MAG: substrate-binding domain-containing protein [Candidatus Eisenbacteria bacterium]|nr:substrate-binding domain-containing protein [Candidatus Eisenbacteria bacterium]